MVFSSLIFIFLFLPITLGVYYLVPRRAQNVILLAFSIFFYAWGEPIYVFLMLFSCVFNYVCGLDIGKDDGRDPRKKLLFAIVVNVAMLGFFKYWGFFLGIVNAVPFIDIPYHDLPLPIGISFFTFQAISYLVDVYRGDVEPQRNILNFSLYLAMFPQLIAGPIVKYHDIADQLDNKRISKANFNSGAALFLIGLAKKVLLANNCGYIYTDICAMGAGDVATTTAWIGILAYTLQIYFDFSGYSDMAIGLGRMFGFEFQINFNYPYISKSITEFWRRWHISLSTWFRDYVYIPLGGNRVGTRRHVFNILVVWMLTGFWHGAAWNFILWGLYYGLLLLFEKYVLAKYLEKLPGFLQVLYTMFIVVIGWVLFSQPTFADVFSYLGYLFGVGAPLVNADTLYYARIGIPVIVIGFICARPNVLNWFKAQQEIHPVACLSVQVVLFVLCIAFLVFDSYNPFLYFRF